jgi:ribonuclease R
MYLRLFYVFRGKTMEGKKKTRKAREQKSPQPASTKERKHLMGRKARRVQAATTESAQPADAKEGQLAGTLEVTKKGFGFLIPADASEDVFIPRSDIHDAVNGDEVLVELIPDARGARRSGSVIKILKRNLTEVTGTFVPAKGYGFVISDDKHIGDVYVAKADWCGAAPGEKVRAEITAYPKGEKGLRGRIVEIYGKAGDAGAELAAVMHNFGIAREFEADVLAEARKVESVHLEPADKLRRDLRDELVITIDGADAKDLDDAVSVSRLGNGNYKLGVHIADVSHYVKEGSALDREALRRGTSVYLLDTVVPMLPEELSNGICSLYPDVDRLTLSVEMEIDQTGEVVAHEIFPSVINSSARMVYTDVSDMLEHHDVALIKKYDKIYPMLCDMEILAAILRKKREAAGSLDFDVAESYIELDKNGRVVDIRPADRRVANRLIEEFMLTANKTVAEHYFWLDIPFLYRVHEKPDAEKMEEFKTFAGSLGYSLKGQTDNVHPKALQDVLAAAKADDAAAIINRVMLKSMKKADYRPGCEGHFGLGFKYYCHFTSPIRRYPDLLIHRIIKESLAGKLRKRRIKELAAIVQNAAELSSKEERVAIDAERVIEKKKKVQYMQEHVGETFWGIISGVIKSGFFVELESTVEGFVPVESLKSDFYEADLQNYRMVGERTRRVYRIGEKVKVRVDKVDAALDEIDFVVVNESKRGHTHGRSRATKPPEKSTRKDRGRDKKHKRGGRSRRKNRSGEHKGK